jgi:hypothetical protein
MVSACALKARSEVFYHNASLMLEGTVTNLANLIKVKPSFRNVWHCQCLSFSFLCESFLVCFCS